MDIVFVEQPLTLSGSATLVGQMDDFFKGVELLWKWSVTIGATPSRFRLLILVSSVEAFSGCGLILECME